MNALIKILVLGLLFMNEIPSQEKYASLPTKEAIQLLFIKSQSVRFLAVASNIMPFIFAVSITCKYLPIQSLNKEIFIIKNLPPNNIGLWRTFSVKFSWKFSAFLLELLFMPPVVIGLMASPTIYHILQSFVHFYLCLVLIIIVCGAAGNSIGFLTATLFQQVRRVSSMTPLILMPMLFFSGFFNKITSMPVYTRWLQYVSPFRYGVHLILQNEYGDMVFRALDGSKYDYQ